MSTRVTLEPSYILHSRPYGETSALLEVFARDQGRVGLVARGARASRSRWKNMLQPFRPLLLSWNLRGELGTLTGAEQVASPPAMAGDPLFCGLYVNELLMRFLHRADPHSGLFEHYGTLLGGLAAGQSPQPMLRVFEYRLLNAAGFGLQLDHEEASGREIRADAWYCYVPESGPVRREPSSGSAEELVSGAALLALKSGNPGTEHLQELKTLMRRMIRHHLGGKALTSQQLFV
jgi:DNA repair protein RecO (recombination protein O)